MSLSLSIAIHRKLNEGFDPVEYTQPYAGMWVPHNDLLNLPECWVLVSDDEYDCTDVPDFLCLATPLYIPEANEIVGAPYGAIYCADPEPEGIATYFRIQRKEN